MIEHVGSLAEAGLRNFYVQSHGEERDYVATVGRIYREALERAFAGQAATDTGDWVNELGGLTRMGLCNGYYFESAGQRYVAGT